MGWVKGGGIPVFVPASEKRAFTPACPAKSIISTIYDAHTMIARFMTAYTTRYVSLLRSYDLAVMMRG
jgi:hypothetical protein